MIPFLHATVNRRKHLIPAMWMIGAMRSGMSVQDAAFHWHDQTLAAELAQRKARNARRLLAAMVRRHPDAPWTARARRAARVAR